jgi:predicted amidophosphoribosyltransferase
MFEAMQLTRSEVVNCDVCFKELPRSEAQCVKARVYVAHVCGAECYDEWEEEEMRERTREAGEP